MRIIPGRVETFFFEMLTRISPKLNTKVYYYRKFRRRLNLDSPKTFNEKILKLKLTEYGASPLVKKCADKFLVREYVKEQGCSELLVPLIAAYDNPQEINWNILPEKFAMKWNFGCGYNIICLDKSKLDRDSTVKKMKKWGGQKEYYLSHSEMQYKDVQKKIVVEQFLDVGKGKLPEDYKFFCMNGVCRVIMVCKDREIGKKARYFWMDTNWNLLPYSMEAIENPFEKIDKPTCLEAAIEYAQKLSEPFKFVRVDLYLIEDKIYFGELTFTPAGGMDVDLLIVPPDENKTVDEILGSYLEL